MTYWYLYKCIGDYDLPETYMIPSELHVPVFFKVMAAITFSLVCIYSW